MTLSEIVDLLAQQRNVQQLKMNAKRQAKLAKAAQARLKMLKAQQQLRDLNDR
jgi:plasmid maintenance system killer protein